MTNTQSIIQTIGCPAKILVPMDFSACSLNALQCARRVAHQCGARIILLHVIEACLTYRVDTTWLEREMMDEARENFSKLLQGCADGALFETLVVRGRPCEEIVKAAR